MATENSANYEAPQAEVVQTSASAQCISTSVPIDNNSTGSINPGDIG